MRIHGFVEYKVYFFKHLKNGIAVLGVLDPEKMVQAKGRTDFTKSVLIKLQTTINAV